MIYEPGTPLGWIVKHEAYLTRCEKEAHLWDKVKKICEDIVKYSKKIDGSHSVSVSTQLIDRLRNALGEGNG